MSSSMCTRGPSPTANLRTKILDLLKHNLNLKGWNSQAYRGFPGKFDSSNVSRDNVSREIGRKHGFSRIPSNSNMVIVNMYSAKTMFTPTMFSRRQ